MVDDNMRKEKNEEIISDKPVKKENIKQKKETNKFSTREVVILVLVTLIVGLSSGFIFKKNTANLSSNVTKDKYLQEFINNYEFILDNYYKELDKEELINNAISGMMNSLEDPYSEYFNEEESNNFSIMLDGSYTGLGVEIAKNEETGQIIITSVFKDSPASKAGLKSGDIIIEVDKKQIDGMDPSEVSNLIKASINKEFELKIIRDSEQITLKVSKEIVTLNSVTSKTYRIDNKKVGYIYISIFANNTYEQFKKELNKLEQEKINTLIIDVRSNTGGHLTTVDRILDLFLNSKQIMYGFEKNGKRIFVNGKGDEKKEYEIVLLGDETSASASEVLISGLRDNLNSKLIGKKTYGKGTVQELVDLSSGTQYKITVKKWLTPKGNCVSDTKGIEPDIEVGIGTKYFETFNESDDLQLQRALEYIKIKQ